MIRIIIAGIVGGLLLFVGGAIEHMVFQWGDRAMQPLPDEATLVEAIRVQGLEHGIYSFPEVPENALSDEEAYNQINERYKQGPNGLLILGRTGEDMMGPQQLGFEFLSCVAAALLASWVVSRMAPGRGYLERWAVVVAIGLFAWFAISTSHGIWYRYHWSYVLDELFCIMFETLLAGAAIAAIVKPKQEAA